MAVKVVVNVPQFKSLADAKQMVEDVYLGLYRASQARESEHEYHLALADLTKGSHFMIVDGLAGTCQPYSHLRVASLAHQGFSTFGYNVSGLREVVVSEEVSTSEDVRLRNAFADILGFATFTWDMLDTLQVLRLFTALQRGMERLSDEWAAKIALLYQSIAIIARSVHEKWDTLLFVQIPDYATTALQPYGVTVAVARTPIS